MKRNGTPNGSSPAAGSARNNRPILHRPVRLSGRAAVVSRFGAALGKRFTRNNLELLGQVQSAYTGLRRWRKTIRGRGANIFTQWVGDPDALGSATVRVNAPREISQR